MRRFLGLLIGMAPMRMLAAFVLMILAAATEGIGVLMLIPLLTLAGVTGGTAATSGVWGWLVARLPSSLGPLLVLYVLVVSGRAALELAESLASMRIEVEVTQTLRERLYRTLVRARWEAIVRLHGARLAHVFTSELDRVSLGVSQLLRGLLDLMIALTYATTAFALSPSLALVAASGALLLLLASSLQQRAARRDGDRLTVLGRQLFQAATEQVGTLKVAKSAGIAEHVAANYAERARTYGGAILDAHRRYVSAGTMVTVGSAAWLALVVFTAVGLLHLSPASLLLLLLLCARLIPRLASVQSHLLLAARASPAAGAVLVLLEELEAAAEGAAGRGTPPMELTRSLELRSITFTYPGASRPALRDVTLAIPVGRVTSLVGASGAGKSTLADVVLLLLAPQHGALYVDGALLADRDRWRAAIGYVPQETHLFHDSVRENVRWIAPDASDADVLGALHLAGASELLARLPKGLDTIIGDRGTLLSGGERQRLALARALLVRPRLLVLDEATSALDPESERAIRQTIAALTPAVTVLMITHRLTTARQADHVVVLDEGAVVAAGEWSSLIASGDSRLSRLWAAQIGLDGADVAEDAARSS